MLGWIRLRRYLCLLGVSALVIIGFVATINALSRRVIGVYRCGFAYRVLGYWWTSI